MEDDFELSSDRGPLLNGTSSPEIPDFQNDMLKYALRRRGSSDSANSQNDNKGQQQQQRSKGQEIQIPFDSTALPLPQRFVVKYLGVRETSNLWGVKHTRGPVDEMVAESKRILSTTSGTLPLLTLEVTESGVTVGPMPQNVNPNFPQGRFPIESISYGVQDLVYTRVFAMIVVKPNSGTQTPASQTESTQQKLRQNPPPFRCHAFVTDKRETAKNLTFALQAAFQKFSQKVASSKVKSKRILIDLGSGETQEQMDSEA